jgi:hypothetical protein
MKKLIVGVVAVGSVLALRPVVKRRMVQKMREHCKQMAGKCKQMMASQSGERSAMREHCKEMASHGANGEEAATPKHSEQEAPQFVGHGEAVAV